MSERIYCNKNWRFSTKFEDWMIERPLEDYEPVCLPHNPKNISPKYFDVSDFQMVCCYQKLIPVPTQWAGMQVSLIFEGVGHDACVYVNEKLVAHHKCGYTSFEVELSEHLSYGNENLITVRVDTRTTQDIPPFGKNVDFIPFGGIYREAYFQISSKAKLMDVFNRAIVLEKINTRRMTDEDILKFETPGIIKTTAKVTPAVYELAMHSKINVAQYLGDKLLFEQPVSHLEKNGNEIIMELSSAPVNVRIWDIVAPNLYEVTTRFSAGGVTIEEVTNTVGFRSSEFRQDGFYLNGRKILLRGLSRNQAYPYAGYAMPESMQRFDVHVLKEELGLNAVRTGYAPASQYFYDECDKLGLLVISEMPGYRYVGGADWKKTALENLKEMIVQNRNHPSVILWSSRINEAGEDDEFFSLTSELSHILDDTRPCGGGRNHAEKSVFEDVFCFNDYSCDGENAGCIPKEKVTGSDTRPYLINEYAGYTYPSKTSDNEEIRLNHAKRHAAVLNSIAGEPDVCGGIGMSFCDYQTMPGFGSGDGVAYHGVMDMFRNPKMAAAVYSADSLTDTAFLEVSTNFIMGEHKKHLIGENYIFTNADKVRMYRNGALLKEYHAADTHYTELEHGPILIDDYVGIDIYSEPDFSRNKAKLVKRYLNKMAMYGENSVKDVTFMDRILMYLYELTPEYLCTLYEKYVLRSGDEKNEIRLDAIRNEHTVKSKIVAGGSGVKLNVKPSHTLLTESHTYDVTELRISATDEQGNLLHNFNEAISLSVTGPIEIIGPSAICLEGGMGGVYLKTTGTDGTASVTLTAESPLPVKINFDIESV